MRYKILIIFLCTILLAILADDSQGELNQNCVTVRDCRTFGYICDYNRTCQCSRYYMPNRRREKCVGGVNQRCKYDEHCIEGAFCQNQATCRCKDEFQPSEDGLYCSLILNDLLSSDSSKVPIFTFVVVFSISSLLLVTYKIPLFIN